MSKPLGKLIDEYYNLREQYKTATRAADDLKDLMSELESDIINRLDSEESTMARGKLASGAVVENKTYVINDADTFYAYLLHTEQPWLLQQRLSGAVKEAVQGGEDIPGIMQITKRRINIRKI